MTVPPASMIACSADFEIAWACTFDLGRDLATGEHLDIGALADEAVGDEDVERDIGIAQLLDEVAEGVQVDRLVLDAERVVEPLQFRHALLEWHLATLEAAGDRVAGALALGATAGCLAALAAGASTDALGVLGGARCGRQIMDLHGQLSLLGGFRRVRIAHPDQVRDPGDHAADLGPIRQRVRVADLAEPERPQRAAVLGLGADRRLDLRDGDGCFSHELLRWWRRRPSPARCTR